MQMGSAGKETGCPSRVLPAEEMRQLARSPSGARWARGVPLLFAFLGALHFSGQERGDEGVRTRQAFEVLRT